MQGSADIARVVYHHQWSSLREWGAALERLGDLNDADIDAIVRGEPAVTERPLS